MKICDAGSSYTKILDTQSGEVAILPTSDLISQTKTSYDIATGHMGRRWAPIYFNELSALAKGSLKLIDEEDFLVLDIGARDTKYIEFRGRDLSKIDWNCSCGSNLGFTVEVLCRYYNVNFEKLAPSEVAIPVACGLLGIERVFDEINSGAKPEEGIAKFLNGIAKSTYLFLRQPKRVYLSGGFCQNRCFLRTLSCFCEVIPIGREVILKGLLLEAMTGENSKPESQLAYFP